MSKQQSVTDIFTTWNKLVKNKNKNKNKILPAFSFTHDIIDVQPMEQLTGIIFYLRYHYNDEWWAEEMEKDKYDIIDKITREDIKNA